ncbi:hypothetical protein EV426DRAFT_144927 [Tirmania nivea]|nr:hypothetical protein EV426DRAFT_144927 [Tirmania nivea]
MQPLYTLLITLLFVDLTTAQGSNQHFPTTAPQVTNFLLRPHRFPLSTYLHPWSFQHHDDLANLTALRDELFFFDGRVRRNGGDTRREFDKGMKRVVRVPKWKGWVSDGGARGGKERDEAVGRLLGGGRVGRVGGWVGDVTLGGGEGQRVEFVSWCGACWGS